MQHAYLKHICSLPLAHRPKGVLLVCTSRVQQSWQYVFQDYLRFPDREKYKIVKCSGIFFSRVPHTSDRLFAIKTLRKSGRGGSLC